MVAMGRIVSLIFLLVLSSCGACDDDEEPVHVPFTGIELPDNKQGATPTAAQDTTGPSGAPSRAVAGPKNVGGRGIDGCCSALRSAARTAKNLGHQKNYRAAVNVCTRHSHSVKRGQITRSYAMARVRASLLVPAPSACR